MSGLLALGICAAAFTYGSSNEPDWSTSIQSNPQPIVYGMDFSTASVIIPHEPESIESPSSIPDHEPESTDSVQNALDTTTDQKEHKNQTLPQDLAPSVAHKILDLSKKTLTPKDVEHMSSQTKYEVVLLNGVIFEKNAEIALIEALPSIREIPFYLFSEPT